MSFAYEIMAFIKDTIVRVDKVELDRAPKDRINWPGVEVNPYFWSSLTGKPWLQTTADVFTSREHLQDIGIPFNTREQVATAHRTIMSFADYDVQTRIHTISALRRVQDLGFAAAFTGSSAGATIASDIPMPSNTDGHHQQRGGHQQLPEPSEASVALTSVPMSRPTMHGGPQNIWCTSHLS
jgi:hypothetical protein